MSGSDGVARLREMCLLQAIAAAICADSRRLTVASRCRGVTPPANDARLSTPPSAGVDHARIAFALVSRVEDAEDRRPRGTSRAASARVEHNAAADVSAAVAR